MPKNILIVEDGVDYREVVKMRLEASGYNVEEAEDGREGIEKVKQSRPDLIILDIKMPQMDGYSFMKKLEEEEIKDIPVIVLTGYKDMELLFRIEGINDYFLKSEDLGALIKKIQSLLGE